MDVEKYLERRSESLERETERIKDFKVFDFAFLPAKLLVRDEAKYLIDAMLKYARTGIPQNLVLLGSRGCGKTLLLRHLQRVLSARLDLQVLYANCRNQNTSFKILAGLLGAPLRGTSLQELYTRFEDRYEGRTVVVLDEVDLISKKDPNKDILYFLSRSERSYMVICLSNNPRVINELDVSIRSSLQAEVHYLQNYDATQLGEILRLRASAGLRKGDEGDLSKIAALTVQRTNSDVRVAIKTLFYAVTGENQEIKLGIHPHNDSETGVANALIGIDLGLEHVQGTINGFGERCGNANLTSILPALVFKMGYKCQAADHMEELYTTSRLVNEMANLPHNRYQPYVGNRITQVTATSGDTASDDTKGGTIAEEVKQMEKDDVLELLRAVVLAQFQQRPLHLAHEVAVALAPFLPRRVGPLDEFPPRFYLLVVTVDLLPVSGQAQDGYEGMADDRHCLLHQHGVGHPHVYPRLGPPVVVEAGFLRGRYTSGALVTADDRTIGHEACS